MVLAEILSRIAAELALFAGVGFLLFAANDLLVDLIYFGRRIWRSLTVYSRFPRAFASSLPASKKPGVMAILVPAWDEFAVIASMLRATLQRLDYPNYKLFVGHYRNDPATAAAIAGVCDERIEAVPIEADGPTTKADCLNHLYAPPFSRSPRAVLRGVRACRYVRLARPSCLSRHRVDRLPPPWVKPCPSHHDDRPQDLQR